MRARARWHEHGKKSTSTKYFLSLRKTNHIQKHVRTLLLSTLITTDPSKQVTLDCNESVRIKATLKAPTGSGAATNVAGQLENKLPGNAYTAPLIINKTDDPFLCIFVLS